MNLIIENKLINPGVINLTQFSSGTDTLIFELENPIYENLDFKNEEYVAYALAVLPTGKIMDKIELEKKVVDEKLTVIWRVTNYTTKENGTLTYQIVFENQNKEVIWYSNNALMFVNSSINADDFLTAHFPSLLQQWMLKMEQLKILIQECTGVPIEGLQGQYLRKRTDEDFDCEWANVIDDSKNSNNQTFSSKKINNLLANKAGTGLVSALKNGLMSKEDKAKLDGIESEAQKNVITGVKGDKEEKYRVGNVNITPKNIGAVPAGKTGDLIPDEANVRNLGSSSKPYDTAFLKGITFNEGTNIMKFDWDGAALSVLMDNQTDKYFLASLPNHSIQFGWNGSKLAVYIDNTFIGNLSFSAS